MATRTFLFVDQVGSTEQLTRLGDAGAMELRTALLDLLRQAVRDAGGHEVDSAGDGLFCAFEGAADAVDAAVAMQQLTWSFNARRPSSRHLSVRVGLHTGEPLVNEDGGYFGTAVVVASRLCSSAQADEVLASDLVRALVQPRGTHAFEAVGTRDLKGVPEPVAVMRVRWEPPPRRALPGELDVLASAPFVGRARELAALDAVWRTVVDGSRRTVAISGDHGMGTTHLAAEFARSALERGATVLAGDARRGRRMGAWADALTTWAASLARAELRIALDRRDGDLDRLVPGLGGAPAQERPAASDADPFLVADALDEVLSRASGVEPVLVVLDHLEEADEDTLTVLRRLATSQRAGRLLLVACYEPSEVGTPRVLALLAALPDVVDVRLSGLADGEVAELIEATTGLAPSRERVRAVVAESEGSPYFVISMAVAQRERDLTAQVTDAVERAEGLRSDLRLQREEITLGLRQLEQLRTTDAAPVAALVEPDGTPPADVPCPYKGLLSFGVEDAADFHGCEALVAELTARLVSSRFLGVVGPSGSGKSSVVTAGLLPALARGGVGGSDMWRPVVLTPGADALASLAGALHRLSPAVEAGALARRLATEPLGAVAAAVSGGQRLVVVVDQGEELWTASSPASRDRVIALLTGAVQDPDADVVAVLVLRSDYYGRAAAHPELAALLTDSQVLVGPLSPSQVRAVVEAPARRAGLVLEPGLSQAVIDDAGDAAGALPLISTALLETWQRRRGRSLTLSGYAEAGGVRRAIARLADATYLELPEVDRPVAQRLLLRLAAPGVDGDDVARRASLGEVTADESARRVLDLFTARRLVTVGADTVQVAHEALLREWPRLRGWLDADRDGRRLHQRVASAATEWEASGRDDDALLRGARLAAATDWQAANDGELTELEREYLQVSATRRRAEIIAGERSSRRRRTTLVVLAGVLVVALVAGGFAAVQRRAAQQRATESLARGLAAQAVERAGSDERASLLLAAEAYRRNASVDTESAVLTAISGSRYLERYVDGLPADVVGIDLSGDRRRAWVVRSNGSIRGYDTSTWTTAGPAPQTRLPDANGSNISPRRDLVAVASSDGLHVIDLTTGVQVGPVRPGPGGDLVSGTFSSDESMIAVSSADSPDVLLEDVATGTVRATVTVPDAGSNLVDVRRSTDEFFITPNFSQPVVRRFGPDGVQRGSDQTMASLQFLDGFGSSPDGSRYIACGGGRCEQRDTESGALIGTPFVHSGTRAYSVVWNPSGARALIASDDGGITVVDDSDLTSPTTSTISGLTGGSAADWLSDDRVLGWSVSGSQRALFDLHRSSPLGTVSEPSTFIAGATPDGGGGQWVLTDGQLVRRSAQPGAPPRDGRVIALEGIATGRHGLAEFPDGRRLLVHGLQLGAGPDGTSFTEDDVVLGEQAIVIDTRTRRVVRTISVNDEEGAHGNGRVAVSPDGREIAVSSGTSVRRFESTTGKPVGEPVRVDSYFVGALAYSANGMWLAAGGQDGILHFIDRDSGRVRHDLAISPNLAFSDQAAVPGTTAIAIASEAGSVTVVDLDRRRRVGLQLLAGGTQLQAVAASGDGNRVAALGRDGSVRVWDRHSGRALGPVIAGLGEAGAAIGFLPEARGKPMRAVAWSDDGRQLVWDLQPAALVERVCDLADRQLTQAEWSQYMTDEPYRATCPRASGA